MNPMPRLMTEQLVRSLYAQSQPGVDGIFPPAITYQRAFFADSNPFPLRAEWLVDYGVAKKVLVVGSAFGYLMEALTDLGVSDVWGIEGGEWYWDAANSNEWSPGMKVRTIQDWLGSGNYAGKYDWIIDEDAAPCHSDSELPAFFSSLEEHLNSGGTIVHLVTPLGPRPGDSSQNWKTMEQWQATAPTHHWVSLHDIRTNE